MGLNMVNVTVPDRNGNFGLFALPFEVSLSPPDSPDFLVQVAPPPPPDAVTLQMYTDFFINDINVEPTTVIAGEKFVIEFNTDPKIVAAFLDLSTLDTTIPAADPAVDYKRPLEDLKAEEFLPEWVTVGADRDLGPIWTVLANLPEHVPGDIEVDILKLVSLSFIEVASRPFTVPAIANRYTAESTVGKETTIKGGRYSVQLYIVKERDDASANETVVTNRFEVSSQEINIGFKNPALDKEAKAPTRRSRRSRRSRSSRTSRNRQVVTIDDDITDNSVDGIDEKEIEFEESAYEIVINERSGKIYTNSPEIPLAGKIPLDKKRNLMVEVFVNGNTMGVVKAAADGTFAIKRIILEEGENTVAAFARSESQLQSPLSSPKTYILDLEPPQVDFVDLPNYSQDLAATINIQYRDNTGTAADFITLIVNNQPQAIDTVSADDNKGRVANFIRQVEVQLVSGANQLVLSAIDAAGNVSNVIQRTLVVDQEQLETAPTNLQAKLTFSGTGVGLSWQADEKASSYNLYRSEQLITTVGVKRSDNPSISTNGGGLQKIVFSEEPTTHQNSDGETFSGLTTHLIRFDPGDTPGWIFQKWTSLTWTDVEVTDEFNQNEFFIYGKEYLYIKKDFTGADFDTVMLSIIHRRSLVAFLSIFNQYFDVAEEDITGKFTAPDYTPTIDNAEAPPDLITLTTTAETTFVDTNVDMGVTYYYALTSVSRSGIEGVKVSKNRNVTVISANKGGAVLLADGTRFRASHQAISTDPTLFNAMTIEDLATGNLPPLPGALSNKVRSFSAVTQAKDLFTDNFNQPVQISLSYPTEARQVEVYRLNLDLAQIAASKPGGEWIKVASTSEIDDPNIKVDPGLITFPANRYGIYGLAGPLTEPWDVNSDGQVDIFDLVQVVKHFAESGDDLIGDVNSDSSVDIFDLVLVIKHFGEVYSTAATAPAIVTAAVDQEPVRIHLEATISEVENRGLREKLCQVNVLAETLPSTRPRDHLLQGYQLDVAYDPYLCGLISVNGVDNINTTGDDSRQAYYCVNPKLGAGRIENIAAVKAIDTATNQSGAETNLSLATIIFRLKSDVDLSLESVDLQNLRFVNARGQLIPVEIDPQIQIQFEGENAPYHYALEQNYPNPFNPETWLPYQLAEPSSVTFWIYNAKGQPVRQLQIGYKPAGIYLGRDRAVYWDGKNDLGESVASGIYYYQIQANATPNSTSWKQIRKMLLLK